MSLLLSSFLRPYNDKVEQLMQKSYREEAVENFKLSHFCKVAFCETYTTIL